MDLVAGSGHFVMLMKKLFVEYDLWLQIIVVGSGESMVFDIQVTDQKSVHSISSKLTSEHVEIIKLEIDTLKMMNSTEN